MPEFADVLDEVLQLRRQLEDMDYFPNAFLMSNLRRIWVLVAKASSDGVSAEDIENAVRRVPSPRVSDLPLAMPKVATLRRRWKGNYLPEGLPILEDSATVGIMLLSGNSEEERAAVSYMLSELLSSPLPVYVEGDTDIIKEEFLLVWPPHTGIIQEWDARTVYPVFSLSPGGLPFWGCKPQLIRTVKWAEGGGMDTAMSGTPLSYPADMSAITRLPRGLQNICCSTKSKLRSGAPFIWWDPEAWPVVRKYLTEQLHWPL